MKIIAQSSPKRCEICHQSDCFDPTTERCLRCHQLIPTAQAIPPQVRYRVEIELGIGEIILWAGQPHPLRMVIATCNQMIGGVVLWTFSIAFFWWYRDLFQLGMDTWDEVTVPLAAVLLTGLGFGLGLFMVPVRAYFQARHTIYAVTSERVLVIQTGSIQIIGTYGKTEIRNIERKDFPYHLGDVTFGRRLCTDDNEDSKIEAVKLAGIRETRLVEMLLRSTFSKGEKPGKT